MRLACLTALAAAAVFASARVAPAQEPKAAPTIDALAERVRLLEEAGVKSKTPTPTPTPMNATPAPATTTSPDTTRLPGGSSDSPVPDYSEGSFSPFTAPTFPAAGTGRPSRIPLTASFGPGFLLRSDDQKYSLQIHYESQVEYRAWAQGDQRPANDGFFLPRQRFFFNGSITEPIEYEISVNRGLGGINVLNAYLNFHFDDRLEVRVGRFFTPFTYDQYAVSNYWLLTPERSVFTTNLSPNRQFGAMAWGYLLDKRLDYAVGVFNGSRNSFEDRDGNRDLVGYVNLRPFQESDGLDALKFLNVGGSLAFGRQNASPSPVTFRIAGGSPDTNIPGNATTPFLILNDGVGENGDRVLGSAHAAYFLGGLSVIGEYQFGYGNYAVAGSSAKSRVPFSGYYVAAGYFLTGEEVERRTRVKPLRPVFPTGDEPRGYGAVEVTGRVSELRIGEEIFTAGLADAAQWSNRARTTELGVNWYLNEYLKVYAFWQHGDFADPVRYAPGRFQKSSDLFWVRTQLYF